MIDTYNPPIHSARIYRFPTEKVMPESESRIRVLRILEQKLRLEAQDNQSPLDRAFAAVRGYHAS